MAVKAAAMAPAAFVHCVSKSKHVVFLVSFMIALRYIIKPNRQAQR
jgi:hypothetical protein